MDDVPRIYRQAELLLVEDNENDAYLVREAFQRTQCKSNTRVHTVPNGQERLAFLRKEGEHEQAPTPDFILLDLNAPGMDGRQTRNSGFCRSLS